MPNFPSWLPGEIESHVQTLIKSGGQGSMEDALYRLATDQDMSKVWEALKRLSSSPQQLIDYLEYVRLHPAVMGWPTDCLDVPGDAVQRKAFKKVAKACEEAVDALAGMGRMKEAQEGWSLLESALQRAELESVAMQRDAALATVINLRGNLQTIQRTLPITEILEMVCLAASLTSNAPDIPLPRKRNTLRPDIIWLAKDLSHYARTQFHRSLHEVVAATVNAALNLDRHSISADDVRKIKHT